MGGLALPLALATCNQGYPSDFSGLVGWWDASARNINAGSPSNSDAVYDWLDLSCNDYTASQSTPSSRPTWIASAINGRPAVRFDGTDDSLAAADHTLTGAFTLFAVVRTDSLTGSATAVHPVYGQWDATGDERSVLLMLNYAVNGSVAISRSHHGTDYQIKRTAANTLTSTVDPYVIAVAYDGEDSASDIYVNGVQVAIDATAEGGGWAVGSGGGNYDSSADVLIGKSAAWSGAARYFDGDMAVVASYGRNLVPAEIEWVSRTLMSKYGVT